MVLQLRRRQAALFLAAWILKREKCLQKSSRSYSIQNLLRLI